MVPNYFAHNLLTFWSLDYTLQVSEVLILKSINLSKIHLFNSIDWSRYEIIDLVKIDWPLYCMASDAGIKVAS